MSRIKQLIVPLIALITFSLGIVCMMLPFLPFGWLLMGVTTLLLVPYFKPLEKIFKWLALKDKTGFSEKALKAVRNFYLWIGDRRKALKMRKFLIWKKQKSVEVAPAEVHEIQTGSTISNNSNSNTKPVRAA